MLRAFKYRLYPTEEQKPAVAKHFGCCRWVYNWALETKTRAWEQSRKQIGRFYLSKQLPKLKRAPETVWLSDVNAQSLQQALVHLEIAFTKFFREKKNYPKFKSKRGKKSFSCPQSVAIDWEASTIWLPRIGWVPIVLHRHFEGKIKTVTISQVSSGKYFASVLVDNSEELPRPKHYSEKTTVGVDVGIKHYATLSTGEKIDNPRYLKQNLARLKREQRRLRRRKHSSINWEKQRIRLAKLHERIANQRKDFLHKLSTRLIRENQAVAFETLSIEYLQRNHKVAQHIHDASWGAFIAFTAYKALWSGKTILRIGRLEKSSRTSKCGWINDRLTLHDRTWTCPMCNRTYDRDIQAAENIKRFALHPDNSVRQDMPELTLVETGVSWS